MRKYNVCALGEILIDFTYAKVSENGAALFEQNAGGAPANVLAAVSKLGGKSAFIGKVGADMHGKFLADTLEKYSICSDGLKVDENYFTTLAFVNLSPSGEREFSFARKPGADIMLCADEVNTDLIENSDIFHIGSLSLTDEPSRSATLFALEKARSAGCVISYDPNYRAMLWKSEGEAKKGMRSVLSMVDIIKISDEETNLLCDTADPKEAAEHLLKSGIKCVIVTMGDKGAYIGTDKAIVFSKSYPASVVDTTGAGDSFMGAFLYRLSSSGRSVDSLTSEELLDFADFSNKAASVCVSRRGAIGAMASMEDISKIK